MKNIIVLGCGRVGRTICEDLSDNFSVSVADISNKNLEKLKSKKINKKNFDISNKSELANNIKDFDLVISAVPGFMGFNTLKTIIKEKKNVVDISFFPEDCLKLKDLAIKNNVSAIVDAGVAPGLSNLILGHYDSLSKVNYYACYVGGLPVTKEKPFEYKAPFSPIDVIEEYTRPARLYENSKIIIKEPLTEKEIINFESIGNLQAFNTDGLRSLLYTMSHIPNMKEKTLRYPGHAEKIEIFKKAGFFNENHVEIMGKKIKPIDFTTELLKKNWYLNESDLEFTVMKIEITDSDHKYTIDLFDEFDTKKNQSSMSRTTGFTCTACANLIAKNLISEKGIIPLETIGKNNSCYNYVINYLKERSVNLITNKKKNN
ncbi:MAG: saccharopine dehydrogenase [Flavobacteriales bacterium]|nr:saccharopine dehydrogenase [Flavobacteriales bacterium]